MSKFKVGDVLVKQVASPGYEKTVGTMAVVSCLPAWGGSYYKLKVLNNEHYSTGHIYLMSQEEQWALCADEELPPAPGSVRYNEGVDVNTFEVKVLRANDYYPLRLRLGVTNKKDFMYTCLTPNEALQLCHDLRRMAMDLKRKEKQNG